jgi:hypothetical protein
VEYLGEAANERQEIVVFMSSPNGEDRENAKIMTKSPTFIFPLLEFIGHVVPHENHSNCLAFECHSVYASNGTFLT